MNRSSHRRRRHDPETGGQPTFCGLLNLNKPTGVTSRRVVDQVDRLVRPAKAGHAGTLDPLAGGVLIVCIGQATRLIEYVQRMPKRYTGTFLLGRESDTEDIEGQVRELPSPPQPSLDQFRVAAGSLTGEILQRPPAYSALKVQGQRAYDLARAGHDVQLAPRPITIHRLDIARYEYPELTLNVECSSGTYVRSLGRDLAEKVGTAAVMSALLRTAIGQFMIEAAVDPDALTSDNLPQHLLPIEQAVQSLPPITLSTADASRIARGQFLDCPTATANELAAFDAAGRLLAILARRPDGQFGPSRNFA
jgi:tRNA pseudouridine55 synthase